MTTTATTSTSSTTTTNTTATTTTTTANGCPSSRQKLPKFTGHNAITVDLWLNLFEVIVVGMTDVGKIQELMFYLDEDPLLWYATDIASKVDTITWQEVKRSLTERFGAPTVHPIVAAQKIYLTRADSVQSYYDKKMRVLRQACIPDAAMVAMLNEGMPLSYRTTLIGSKIANPVEWLMIALQLEAAFARPLRSRPPSVNLIPTDTRRPPPNRSNPQRSTKRPSTPCRFCQQRGQTQFHWHSECTNRNWQNMQPNQLQNRTQMNNTSANTFTAIDHQNEVAFQAPDVQALNYLGDQ